MSMLNVGELVSNLKKTQTDSKVMPRFAKFLNNAGQYIGLAAVGVISISFGFLKINEFFAGSKKDFTEDNSQQRGRRHDRRH